jgi:hypothetical protein
VWSGVEEETTVENFQWEMIRKKGNRVVSMSDQKAKLARIGC